jgi:hypothetical protein
VTSVRDSSYGNRVKLLRLTPEPKPLAVGIAAPKGRLTPAAEQFWHCAKQAALARDGGSSPNETVR